MSPTAALGRPGAVLQAFRVALPVRRLLPAAAGPPKLSVAKAAMMAAHEDQCGGAGEGAVNWENWRRAALVAVTAAVCASLARPIAAQDWLYTVRPGDTLWGLSETYLVDVGYWRQLRSLNAVADPEHLPPGTRLRIPIAWLRLQPAPVRVVAVSGTAIGVTTLSGQRAPVALATAMEFFAGDSIETGNDGSVSLEFADGSRMLVGSDTRLVFDTLSVTGGEAFVDTRLRLLNGHTSVRTRPGDDTIIRYEISTPAAISAVRGTEFRVGVQDGGNAARTEVLNGEVAVTGRARTLMIAEGFGTVVDRGRPPRPPRPLLPAPDLGAMDDVIERIPVRLRFAPVPGAASYRLEVAANPSFEPVLVDRISPDAVFSGFELADGGYAVRVRCIDALGIEGFDGLKRVVVNARPEPPLPLDPPPGGVVPDGKPGLRWTEPEEAKGYHLQLAAEGNDARPLVDVKPVDGTRFTLDRALAPGRYRWRIATIAADGDEGPFSDAQGFRVPPPGPSAAAPEVGDGTVTVRWRAGEPGDRYRLQVARNKDFTEVVVDLRADAPQATLGRLDAGRYFVRVATIDASGEEGPFGAPQEFSVGTDRYWLLILPFLGLALAVLL